MKKRKKRTVFWVELFKANDFAKLIVSICVLFIIIFLKAVITKTLSFESLLDIRTFTVVLSAFILNFFTNAILNAYKKHKEDDSKVTTDYDSLVKMYSLNSEMLEYSNDGSDEKNITLGKKNTTCLSVGEKDDTVSEKMHKINKKDATNQDYRTYQIPITNVISIKGKTLELNNENFRVCYQRPKEIDSLYADIMNAHAYSKTYNQLNIRCDKVEEDDSNVTLYLSKTTYYDSLLTNRAMDYPVKGASVRERFMYGPYLQPLEDSVLSNHLGYNGFVETSDGKIVFIFRNKYVSISKNTMQSSVGASLKVKYACEHGEVTKKGVVYAIKKEIEAELCLKKLDKYDERKDKIFENLNIGSVLYFYRELVEGGKPQLMFYVKLDLHSDEIRGAYTKGVKKFKKGDMYCTVDGFKMLFVDKKDLKKIYVTPDGMTINNKFYKSVPTSTGTLVLLIKYLTDKGEI